MTNIFVTGGTGFVGKSLVRILLRKGYNIHVLCRKESTGENLKHEKGHNRGMLTIHYGNIIDKDSYDYLLDDIDFVFHFAALFRLESTKEELYKINVEGTRKLLESCTEKENIKRIICCSTTGVYELSDRAIDERHPHRKFTDLHKYEWSKAEMENVCMSYYKKYNLPIILLRPTAIYGPSSRYLFYTILELIKKGKVKAYFGKGDNRIHFVHVEDVTGAAIHLMNKGEVGEVYNICDDTPISIKEAMDILFEALDKKNPRITVPVFMAKHLSKYFGVSNELFNYMIEERQYTNEKLKKTGYKLKYPNLRKGIKETIEKYYK